MAEDMNRALAAPKDIEGLLAQPERTAELDALLAETGISRERFVRTVVHALAENPDVMTASRGSILLAVLDAARMGLEPTGQYGGGYLIRRRGKATFAVDWRAFIKMGMAAGAISAADADIVYAGDQFYYRRGTNPYVEHRPTLGPERGEDERGNPTHVYFILTLPDGTKHFEVMTLAEVNAIMKRSPAHADGPWVTDWTEMARKTVVRRAFKYVPAVYNPSLAYALSREDRLEAESGPSTDGDGSRKPATVREAAVAALVSGGTEAASEEPAAESEPVAVEQNSAELIEGNPADSEEGLPA